MDRADYVQARKRKYMAQVLEAFEQQIEAHLPDDFPPGQIQDFKGRVRSRFNALATDATEIMSLDGGGINGVALAQRDALSPVGRP